MHGDMLGNEFDVSEVMFLGTAVLLCTVASSLHFNTPDGVNRTSYTNYVLTYPNNIFSAALHGQRWVFLAKKYRTRRQKE